MSDENPGQSDQLLDEVRKLFADLRRLPVTERAAFLARITNTDVRAQVTELLRAYDDSKVDVEGIVAGAAEAVQARPILKPHTRIGAYEILDLLGEGGMGQVFLAERADRQFNQKVAVKVLSSRAPNTSLVERFRSERQILANLNHPGIARLLDGGETEDGLPYLVMEFVEGRSILEYCDEKKLSVTNRLRLFEMVCNAIQHAHQNFVIHRDIKSSNIIVDESGQPKLLDFGIAKLLEHDSVESAGLTKAEARVMTPANASPEQIRGTAITSATDVYALGLLLYELLTGVPAYSIQATSRYEYEKQVCETIPEPPSKRIDQLEQQHARLRDSTLERLRKRLHGDLDVIILKALRKEPDRRYSTVAAFRDDIQRYQTSRPVRARPDTWRYRFGKFIRRNAVSAGVASVLVVSLVAFSATTLIQNRIILEERDTANRVSDFLMDIFASAKPEAKLGDVVTAEQILDNGYEKIQDELREDPRIRARLLQVMGESYRSLGLHSDSVGLLLESAELALAGNMAADETIEVLGMTGEVLSYLGRFDEANTQLAEAERRLADMHNASPRLTSNTLTRIANNLNRQDDLTGGLERLIEAEQYAREIVDDEAGTYPNLLHTIGSWQMMLGNYDESERWLRQALASEHPRYRDPTISRAITLGVLGSVLNAQAEFSESLKMLAESLDILKSESGEDHVNVGITYSTIGVVNLSLKSFDESEAALREAERILIGALGPDHYRVGTLYGYFANLERERGDLPLALEHLARSLEIKRQSLDPNHTSISVSLQKMATIHHQLQQSDRALALINKALAIHATTPNQQNINEAMAYLTLGSIQFDLDELTAAETALRQARPIFRTLNLARGDAQVADYLSRIAARLENCAAATTEMAHAVAYYREQAPRFDEDISKLEQANSVCSGQ